MRARTTLPLWIAASIGACAGAPPKTTTTAVAPPSASSPTSSASGTPEIPPEVAIDTTTMPIAVTEMESRRQVSLAAPGKGWFCYELEFKGKTLRSSCHREHADCTKTRDDGESAFGSVVGDYTACKPRALAECFVLRVHADFVPLDLQVDCSETHEQCVGDREHMTKDPKFEVGAFCVEAE